MKKNWKEFSKYIRKNTRIDVSYEEELMIFCYIETNNFHSSVSSYLSLYSNKMTERLFACLSSGYVLYRENKWINITDIKSIDKLSKTCEIIDIK